MSDYVSYPSLPRGLIGLCIHQCVGDCQASCAWDCSEVSHDGRCRWFCANHCLWCVYRDQTFDFGKPHANPGMSDSELLNSFEGQFVACVVSDDQSSSSLSDYLRKYRAAILSFKFDPDTFRPLDLLRLALMKVCSQQCPRREFLWVVYGMACVAYDYSRTWRNWQQPRLLKNVSM